MRNITKQHLQNPLLGPQRIQRTFWVFRNWHIDRMKVGDGSQKDTILYSNYSEQEERLQTTKFPVQYANNQCSWDYWLATSCKFAPEFSLNSSHSCCLTNVFCRSKGTCTLPQQFKRQDNYLKEITLFKKWLYTLVCWPPIISLLKCSIIDQAIFRVNSLKWWISFSKSLRAYVVKATINL